MEFMYSFISEGMDRRPAYGYSHRLRAAVEKPNITPSPLDYQSNASYVNKNKGFSFGHRPRTNYVKDMDLPSPAEYFVGEEIKKFRLLNQPTFGIKPKIRRPISHSPGPLAYYPQRDFDKYNRKKPGHGFGTEIRRSTFRARDENPGPGEYNTRKSDFNKYHDRGFSFGLRFPTLIS